MSVEKYEKKEDQCLIENKKETKDELIQSLAQQLINKLTTTSDFNEAFNDTIKAFQFFESFFYILKEKKYFFDLDGIQKKNEKIIQENKLLKKAFCKQFQKTEVIFFFYSSIIKLL